MIILYAIDDIRKWTQSPGLKIFSATIEHLPAADHVPIQRALAVVIVDKAEGVVHFVKSVPGLPLFMSWYDFLMWMSAQP